MAHYLIGIVFSMLLILIVGDNWLQYPTFWPALLMVAISVVAPFLLMQPCFGFGTAAAKTRAPWLASRRSLVAHASFGIGLWLSALLLVFA